MYLYCCNIVAEITPHLQIHGMVSYNIVTNVIFNVTLTFNVIVYKWNHLIFETNSAVQQ